MVANLAWGGDELVVGGCDGVGYGLGGWEVKRSWFTVWFGWKGGYGLRWP
uniref:Uncharacterized protein n=1 Tax=Fagus sylvatica TaxID=28930 RepID=A0A2N9E5T7_FAGSY